MLPISLSRHVADATAPVLVGFSGGLDSTVLLHLLAHAPEQRARGLCAVHVHHGLNAAADDWAAHCQRVCAQWQVPLHVAHVRVDDAAGIGPEAAARQARYAAFTAVLLPGQWLALAHHRDDQAETFLLRALRGSGVDGLAAMRTRRDFAAGQLWRPLLSLPRAALEAHARQHGLRWIEDSSNGDDAFDRNFLRNEVMPLLTARWPHAASRLALSASLADEAATLLQARDQQALHACADEDGALRVADLRALSAAESARVLRLWVRQRGLPPLPGNGVARVQNDLLDASHGSQAEFRWRDACIIRWRERLHAIGALSPWPDGWQVEWDGHAPLPLPDGGALELHGAAAFDAPLRVRQRHGGERIRLPGRDRSHLLKHAMQAANIPPWLRPHLPLLCDGAQVLSAGDRLVSAALHDWLHARHARLRWRAPGASD